MKYNEFVAQDEQAQDEQSDRSPGGPSTQYLKILFPKIIKGMVLRPEYLDHPLGRPSRAPVS